jgi:pimeloyl-ACP methyl ester carboxylesterase
MLNQIQTVVATDGAPIAYEQIGAGPPLVMVHGTADDRRCWTPLLPALAARFTVYALDRRGRGGSGDDTTHAIEQEFDDVAAVIDAIGEPAGLFGHSYGALCALEAALRAERLASLILYEPPIPIPAGAPVCPPQTLATMSSCLAAGDRDGVVLAFAREIARLPEEEIAAARSSPTWQATLETAHTIAREIQAVEGYVFDPARFRDLTTPVLLLLGSESPPFLTAATEAVADALPNSRLAILPGQGHLAMHTAPDLFLREVIPFLAERQPTR